MDNRVYDVSADEDRLVGFAEDCSSNDRNPDLNIFAVMISSSFEAHIWFVSRSVVVRPRFVSVDMSLRVFAMAISVSIPV